MISNDTWKLEAIKSTLGFATLVVCYGFHVPFLLGLGLAVAVMGITTAVFYMARR